MLDSFWMTRPKRGRSLSLPQNTQNGLWPSQDTQKVLGIKDSDLGVLCLLCAAKLFCGKKRWRRILPLIAQIRASPDTDPGTSIFGHEWGTRLVSA